MKVFTDTEFYESSSDGIVRIELISIGMTTLAGDLLYAENYDFDWSQVPADHWLQENVRPHLQGHENPDILMSPHEIAEWVIDFCGPKPVVYGWYSDYDWVLICALFGSMSDLPEHFPRYCRDLKHTVDDLHMSEEELPATEGAEHNALDDAINIKAIYGACRDKSYGLSMADRHREMGHD